MRRCLDRVRGDALLISLIFHHRLQQPSTVPARLKRGSPWLPPLFQFFLDAIDQLVRYQDFDIFTSRFLDGRANDNGIIDNLFLCVTHGNTQCLSLISSDWFGPILHAINRAVRRKSTAATRIPENGRARQLGDGRTARCRTPRIFFAPVQNSVAAKTVRTAAIPIWTTRDAICVFVASVTHSAFKSCVYKF